LKTDTGVWIEQFLTASPRTDTAPTSAFPNPSAGGGAPAAAPVAPATAADEVAWITLVCRGINLENIIAGANSTIYYGLEHELKESPMFEAGQTGLKGNVTPDEATGTFSFPVVVRLKHPLKL